MKATIWRNGVLSIEPENELEGYALDKWCKDNKEIFENFHIAITTTLNK